MEFKDYYSTLGVAKTATDKEIKQAFRKLARKHAEWESGLSGAVSDAGDDPRARILAVYGYLENWFCADDFRGCAFINAFGELGGTNAEVAEIVRAHKASFQEYMAGLVADTGAPPALAAQLSILAEGAQSTAAISADPAVAAQARGAAEDAEALPLLLHMPVPIQATSGASS